MGRCWRLGCGWRSRELAYECHPLCRDPVVSDKAKEVRPKSHVSRHKLNSMRSAPSLSICEYGHAPSEHVIELEPNRARAAESGPSGGGQTRRGSCQQSGAVGVGTGSQRSLLRGRGEPGAHAEPAAAPLLARRRGVGHRPRAPRRRQVRAAQPRRTLVTAPPGRPRADAERAHLFLRRDEASDPRADTACDEARRCPPARGWGDGTLSG